MYLPYKEEVINEGELEKSNFKHRKFIGYLTPRGETLDYSLPFGLSGHDNCLYTAIFEKYFIKRYYDCRRHGDKNSQDIDEKRMMEWYICDIKDNLDNLKKMFRYYISHGIYHEEDSIQIKLYEFFYNCYQNELFSVGYGKDVIFHDRADFEDYTRREYNRYVDWKMLDLLKETFIQYLGLHAVERTEKTITTSNRNIYETFYNYLLNDYTIYKLPNMIYDEKLKKYVEYDGDNYFLSSKEQKLKMEINSIKRLVKKEDRYKYYRD